MALKQKVSQSFRLDHLAALPHATPFFVLSTGAIKRRYRRFTEQFPESEICYAIKANSEPHVLQTLNSLGSSFEAASHFELELLRKQNVPAERVIYGTAVKPLEQIKTAAKIGITRFAFDSIQELDHIAEGAPGAKVYARGLVDDAGSVFTMSEKFGAPINTLVPLMLEAKKRGLVPYGLSFNVGSQAASADVWKEGMRQMGEVMADLDEVGIRLEALNLGGGYPGTYASDPEAVSLEAIAQVVGEARAQLPYAVKLLLEPGRGIISEAAVLVASVIAKIQRGDRTWLYLDAGSYNALFESMVYQGSMRYHTNVLSDADGKPAQFVLTGPTGDGLDIVSYDAELPSSIDVGDRVVFHHVGAYSLTLASAFNGFPRPDVYITD